MQPKSSRNHLFAATVTYLLITASLIRFAGAYGMFWRLVSLQFCVPFLTICALHYLWSFGLADKTPDVAKGRHFSTLKPKTQFILRTILKSTGILVGAFFLLGIVLPLEIKTSELVFFGKSVQIEAEVVGGGSPRAVGFLLQHLTVRTSDGQIDKLDYYLPADRLTVGSWYSFRLLSGTSLVADAMRKS